MQNRYIVSMVIMTCLRVLPTDKTLVCFVKTSASTHTHTQRENKQIFNQILQGSVHQKWKLYGDYHIFVFLYINSHDLPQKSNQNPFLLKKNKRHTILEQNKKVTNNRWIATLKFFSCTVRIDVIVVVIIRSSAHWWWTSLYSFLTCQFCTCYDHSLPSLLHLQWEPDIQMIRMTVGAVWALRALTHKDSITPISCHLPHLTSSISQKTHRALRTHKEQACQHGHSLVWQREGQMALNHTSSSGHLIKRQVCVCGRDPNRQNTQLFQHPSIESQWFPLLPLSSSANDQTWHLQTKYSPTHPARVTSPLSTDRLFPSTSPLTPYLKV